MRSNSQAKFKKKFLVDVLKSDLNKSIVQWYDTKFIEIANTCRMHTDKLARITYKYQIQIQYIILSIKKL